MKIKLFENFKNDERKGWRLTDEMKSKIDSEIKNVLIELIDNGFEIEIDHFAKKIAGDNSILVSVHRPCWNLQSHAPCYTRHNCIVSNTFAAPRPYPGFPPPNF